MGADKMTEEQKEKYANFLDKVLDELKELIEENLE